MVASLIPGRPHFRVISPTIPLPPDAGCFQQTACRAGGPAPAAGGRRGRRPAPAAPPASPGRSQRGRDHAPDHQREALGLRLRRERERLGEAAGLVELDVHGIVFADQSRERGAVMHAFVCADGDRSRNRCERRVVGCRQRLLDEGDACRRAGGEIGARGSPRVPSLVGIDDQLGLGRRPRTAAMRSGSPSPPSLTFRQGPRRCGGRGGCHGCRAWPARSCRRSAADAAGRARGIHGPGGPLRLASRSMKAQSSALRAAPAGRARWSSVAAEAAGHVFGEARDRRRDACHGLAIAGIGRALAAAADAPSESSATTTSASVFEPRLMVKAPAIGQRSAAHGKAGVGHQ